MLLVELNWKQIAVPKEFEDIATAYVEQIIKLEEERNKWRWKYNRLKSEFNLLQDKNIKLKEENSYRAKVVDIIPQDEKSVSEETIKDLQERIRFLEESLDRKEKVNISLREENKRLSDFLECEA